MLPDAEGNGADVPLRVVVMGVNGRSNGRARVEVINEQGVSTRLTRGEDGQSYIGRLPSGRYQLAVSAGRLVAPDQTVNLTAESVVTAHLGELGWPFYRLGDTVVPFPPPDELVAVAFPEQAPSELEAADLGRVLLTTLRDRGLTVRPRQLGPRRPRSPGVDFWHANGAIWVFEVGGATNPGVRDGVADVARGVLGVRARAGILVDRTPGQLKVIDDRLVVRFRDDLDDNAAREIIAEAGARLVRPLTRLGHRIYVIDMRTNPLAALRRLEEWRGRDLLVWGEPEVLAEIVDDTFPATPPDDPEYQAGKQANLTLQGVELAWQTLASNLAHTLGNPAITVCTLDSGVALDHPDLGGTLTDGSAQLARCYDFRSLAECTAPGYQPGSHGMGVVGIIAAHTNNGEQIAGIAPNTRQICLKRPDLESSNYPCILYWAAGFTTGHPGPGWPAEPLNPPADIINCSHGANFEPLSNLLKETFQEIAQNGRNNLGAVVIYSAGDDNHGVAGYRTWAAWPDNIAVTNTMRTLAGERRGTNSNFGPEIDICAQGADIRSLDITGNPPQVFDDTSAAAPTVSAVVALMLSRNPALTRAEVVAILTGTAEKIDAGNMDPIGKWDVTDFSQWYGHGRVRADDAVANS